MRMVLPAVSGNENIELKAADADPAASERACRALGAVDCGVLAQRDTYFAVERGLLKLREDSEAGTGELIFYVRAREDGARASS
jgi:adenylate cyclase, class 2